VRRRVTIRVRLDGVRTVRETPAPPWNELALPGWMCRACRVFNGEAKETLWACRCCGAPRPETEEKREEP
jgi:hypothetical protein